MSENENFNEGEIIWAKTEEYPWWPSIIISLIIDIIYYNLMMGMGIGDWGLGIGDWAQSPIPNPQSPIPNPQSP